METSIGSTPTERRYAGMDSHQQVRSFQARWELAKKLVDLVFEEVESFDQQDIYPAIPLTISCIVSNLYGFTPDTHLVDASVALAHSHTAPVWPVAEELTQRELAGNR